MKTEYSVLHILNSICAKNTNRIEINHLIELAQKFAYSYLKYRYKNLSKILLAEDVSLKELSIDAIAPLFERDDERIFIKIKYAFEKWQPPIDNEETALFFVNRIVSKSVEKYVSELLRQSDPFFSKILDSINYLIEKQNYRKMHIIGTTYIIADRDFIKTGELPDNKFIYELPAELFGVMNRIIEQVFSYINSKTNLAAAIPLNALVLRIKQVRSAEYKISDITYNEHQTDIESVTKKAIHITIKKLEEVYLQKDKINQLEFNAIKSAIDSIVYDMRDGGMNTGVHKYLIEKMDDLTFDVYKKKYQNLFEYLIKILKKEMADQFNI